MKLIFFIPTLEGGGAERVLSVLVNELCERGYEIVVCSSLKRNIAYKISPKIRLCDYRENELNVFESNFLLRIYNKIANRFIFYRNVKDILKREKPDIVISFMRTVVAQLLILCFHKYPLVMSEHSTFNQKHKPLRYIKKFWLLNFADKVTILTNYDKAYLRNNLKNKIVVPNPLPFPPMDLCEYEENFSQRKNIIACGTLYWVKGFDNLIIGFSKIAKQHPDWSLDILGRGDATYLKNVAKEYDVIDQVNFLGFQQNIHEIMKEHSIFVLSSHIEGFSMALIEAMASGCACVSYDCIAGPGEIIVDSVDGSLVENQNLDKLSAALEDLICNEEKRYNFGKNAILNVRRFSLDRIVSKWEDIFNELNGKYK